MNITAWAIQLCPLLVIISYFGYVYELLIYLYLVILLTYLGIFTYPS